MNSPLTLSELRDRQSIGKDTFYRAITGEGFGPPLNAGEIHSFDIKPEEMDDAYLVAKKLQRRYRNPALLQIPRSTDSYFHPSFVEIDEAYLSGDLGRFQEAIGGLLTRIVKL